MSKQSRITFHLDPLLHADLEEFVAKRKADKLRAGIVEPTSDKAPPSTLGGVIQEALEIFLKAQGGKKS
jgi:hypothetical protein